MPRKPIGDKPMTDAERQARRRAALAAGKPVSRIRSPADRRSRIQRWRDAVAELTAVQAQCVRNPSQGGQLFRRKADTDSDGSRTVIPIDPGQP